MRSSERHTKAWCTGNLNLNGAPGNTSVQTGQDGFLISGGSLCSVPKWFHAVTTLKRVDSNQSNIISDIKLTLGDAANGAGDMTIKAEAGNGAFDVSVSGGLLQMEGTGKTTANANSNSKAVIKLSIDDICTKLATHTIKAKAGGAISVTSGGLYTTCKPDTVTELDVGVCPGGGILIDSSCGLKLDDQKTSCVLMGGVNVDRISTVESGGGAHVPA